MASDPPTLQLVNIGPDRAVTVLVRSYRSPVDGGEAIDGAARMARLSPCTPAVA